MQDGHLGVVLYFYQKLLPAFLEVSVCLVSTSTFLQHETCTGGSQSQMCRGQASDTNEQIRGVSFKQKHTLFTYLFLFTYLNVSIILLFHKGEYCIFVTFDRHRY